MAGSGAGTFGLVSMLCHIIRAVHGLSNPFLSQTILLRLYQRAKRQGCLVLNTSFIHVS